MEAISPITSPSSSISSSDLAGPLEILPPVDFCCAYGSSLLPINSSNKMVDYILGVSDPLRWHSENLERNRDHYASWMAHLGPRVITGVADRIGVGVHFNPYVKWEDKMIKYGVVRMHDLVQDLLYWERFYLSGRLQKPVKILVDNLDIKDVNMVNLRYAISAALLLLPPEFTEVDLYAKICSLSYMGDVRMLFAEDRSKVKKIVQGTFKSFQAMYKPILNEYTEKEMLEFSIFINSREEAAKFTRKFISRRVMGSSARQAVSGFLAAGGVNAVRYVAGKISKAWKSRT
ncbi:hypothetical protein QJS04_geneDACA020005 [Acorus gramineus]|uniref:Phosphatidate cytidylyltransferase, mitochondrial n=1 Tax=Acorus gramineus TaxID=55184 RepID=A0AAV9A761_ACOGR|nr:hypothetical protein QJS04_geneDACA020005 [Acorus gramineus]